MSEALALEISGLTHKYNKLTALDGVSLALAPNRIYGLLGRNGSGKTTLLNIISKSLFPKAGRVVMFGAEAFERPSVLRKLCYVREKNMAPPGARARDILMGCRQAYPNWDEKYARNLIDMFSLNISKKYKQLSRGMESTLGLIIGLASRAELTVFDEPSLGLDPAARGLFYDEVRRDIDKYPRTALISTHLIDEVSRLFDEVVIIDKGRILAVSTVETLLSGYISLTGPLNLIEGAMSGLRILRTDELGGAARVISEWDGRALPGGLIVDSAPLQNVFVHMTEGDVSR
jgi:ABC-2 type transport system ATP-binding protein